LAFQTGWKFTPKSPLFSTQTSNFNSNYLTGIWAAPEAASAGAATAGTGAVIAAPSSTLAELAAGLAVPK